MSQSSYLVALALIEQGEKRIMPIGGKSLKDPIKQNNFSGNNYEKIALELLIRILGLTDKGSIKKSYGEESLLLVQLSIDSLQKNLPLLKKSWIETGDGSLFLRGLKEISSGIWTLNFIRYEGISIKRI